MKKHFLLILTIVLFTGQGCGGRELKSTLNNRYARLLKETAIERPAAPAAGGTPEMARPEEDALKGLKTLEIEKAVETALANNPDLRSIKMRVREASERYPQAVSLDDPSLGIGFYPATIGSGGPDFSYRVDLSQRLPYPGRLALKGEVALGDAEAALKDFHSARLELVRMVRTSWLELFYVHRAMEINREEKRLLEELKTVTTSRYAEGRGNLQDPLQTEVELARIKHRGIVLERMLRNAGARLNTLMGRPPGLPLPVPAGLPDIKIKKLPEKRELVDRALSKNPDIEAARIKKQSAESALKLTDLEYYPDLTLIGSYNRAWSSDELRPFVGIGINIPIRFGRIDAQRREAGARVMRMDSELKAIQDRVRYEVEEAYEKLRESVHAVKLFEETLIPAAKLNHRAALAGYKEGKNDFLALLSAERELVETRLQYERTLVDLRIREAELLRAVGEER